MTYLALILIAVVVIRRTKLSGMVLSAALLGGLVESLVSVDMLTSVTAMASINALLTFGCLWHWKGSDYKVAGYITFLSFGCLCLSFTQLFVFSNISDSHLHILIQDILLGIVDGVTFIIAMLILTQEDRAYDLHDITSSFKSYLHRFSSVFSLSRNREGKQ
jgi:hypothetical protein